MSNENYKLLALQRLPGRLTSEEAAPLLDVVVKVGRRHGRELRRRRIRGTDRGRVGHAAIESAAHVQVIDREQACRRSSRKDPNERSLQVVIKPARKEHGLECLPHREFLEVAGEGAADV